MFNLAKRKYHNLFNCMNCDLFFSTLKCLVVYSNTQYGIKDGPFWQLWLKFHHLQYVAQGKGIESNLSNLHTQLVDYITLVVG